MPTRLSPFNSRKFKARPQSFIPATISDFSGGLNAVDNDTTMKTKYAKVLNNWQKNTDGSNSVRWGTGFKYDIAGTVTGELIEVVYFNSHLIAFTTTGQICKITEAGVITKIWDDAIAALLIGAPDGWSTGLEIGSIDTTEFKGKLVVCNGVDKPLLIDEDIVVDYLQDPATGSNVFTPVGKYCTTVANFCIIAGIESSPGEIYISSEGTSGVWVGDPDPNNGLSLNLSSYVPQNSSTIIGLSSFRNNLIVQFEGAIVVVELGQFDELVHKPAVQDNIVEHGIINHRTNITTKNDLIMADTLGWHTAVKTQFGLIETQALSELVDPLYQSTTTFGVADRKLCFAVYNALEHRVFLFVKVGAVYDCWVMSISKDSAKKPAWARFQGWTWTCACTSAKGRVFFGKDTKIYQYGNEVFADEDYTADLVNDYDSVWTTTTNYAVDDRVLRSGTVYIAVEAHTAGDFDDDLAADLWQEYLGEEIVFDWELPWTDVNKRTQKKRLAYIKADTEGTAQFTISCFIDKIYKNEDDEYDPAVTTDFVAGDSGGYGAGDQPYGGGRRLRDERPWGMPTDFNILKIRVHGASRKPLRIVTMSILYLVGSFRR